ncbi:MAG: AI-2E family transporter [Prosthecobacter sp.]|uniref:AI-2E family transporter n=1 Tax=Prosthecobacter sp. TaxID=1965333 RepID=UPI0025FDEEF4|nr:AI-2E family transporter [Prosthecobacter sp.]MCF7786917.1 AI-2E family transporter [Prosthecobacter sp.]
MTPPSWHSHEAFRLRTLVLIAAIVTGINLCYLLAEPFLPALTWAIALSVLFTPFQKWLESKLSHPGLSAMIAVVVIAFIVVVPVVFVGQNLVGQAAQGAQLIETKVASGEWRRAIDAQPRLAPVAEKIERELDLPGMVKSLATWFSTKAGAFVSGSMIQVVSFGLIFYLLFFFLRDRRGVLASLHHLSPLSREETETLFLRVRDTIRATVYGTLVVSLIQGLLGGLMFWWLGLPAPLLWGMVMAILSVVPMLGAFVVWTPAALFLALEGSWGKALILILWGMLVVGTVDNLLRPVLVANLLKLHTVLAFISVVGGLMLFGPAGLILGPVVLTITTVLLETWRSRSDDKLGIQ